MRLLPFERAYHLDSEACDRCGGTGEFAGAGSGRSDCFNCRRLGRKITREGRELFYEICELLSKPVLERESRIEPKHLETILGKQLRVGMRVARMRDGPAAAVREIVQLVPLSLAQARLVFTDGSVEVASPIETYVRELAPAELDAVEAFMATRLSAGAVRAGT